MATPPPPLLRVLLQYWWQIQVRLLQIPFSSSSFASSSLPLPLHDSIWWLECRPSSLPLPLLDSIWWLECRMCSLELILVWCAIVSAVGEEPQRPVCLGCQCWFLSVTMQLFCYSWGRICFIFLLLVGEGFGAVNVTKGFGAINVTNTNCGCTILIITVLKNINEEYLQTNIFLFVFTI